MADTPTTPPANLQDSKKGQGFIYALIAGVVVTAAAVAVSPAIPAALTALPDILGFITLVTGFHQGAQGAQDIFNAKNSNKPCDPPAPK